MKSRLLIACVFSLVCLSVQAVERGDTDRKAVKIDRGGLYWLLNRACANGDEIGVRILLGAGADINGISDYKEFQKKGFGFEPSWPLNLAASYGHEEIVKLLIKEGAKVDNPEGDGGSYTALTFAVSKGHEEIVKILLKSGAVKNIKSFSGTPIEIARAKKFENIVELLEK